MLLKQKHPSLLRNLFLGTFAKLLIVFSTMVNLLYIPPLFNDPVVLFSASDKAKLFAKNFSKNSNLDDLGISLPVFPSITNLNLHNIFITHEMVKKVLTNLCSSKASGPDCNNNRSGVLIQLMHPRRFNRVWQASPLHKLRSCGISGQIFGLISSFLSNRWLLVVLDGKSSQEYPVHAGVPQRYSF